METLYRAEANSLGLELGSVPGAGALPLVVQPRQPGRSLSSALEGLRESVARNLHRAGGILFRGFQVEGVDAFRDFAGNFGSSLLSPSMKRRIGMSFASKRPIFACHFARPDVAARTPLSRRVLTPRLVRKRRRTRAPGA